MEHTREYRVPLSARALEMLVEGGEHSIDSEWVCPSPGGWVLSGRDCSDVLPKLFEIALRRDPRWYAGNNLYSD